MGKFTLREKARCSNLKVTKEEEIDDIGRLLDYLSKPWVAATSNCGTKTITSFIPIGAEATARALQMLSCATVRGKRSQLKESAAVGLGRKLRGLHTIASPLLCSVEGAVSMAENAV